MISGSCFTYPCSLILSHVNCLTWIVSVAVGYPLLIRVSALLLAIAHRVLCHFTFMVSCHKVTGLQITVVPLSGWQPFLICCPYIQSSSSLTLSYSVTFCICWHFILLDETWIFHLSTIRIEDLWFHCMFAQLFNSICLEFATPNFMLPFSFSFYRWFRTLLLASWSSDIILLYLVLLTCAFLILFL